MRFRQAAGWQGWAELLGRRKLPDSKAPRSGRQEEPYSTVRTEVAIGDQERPPDSRTQAFVNHKHIIDVVIACGLVGRHDDATDERQEP
jgi:hypothetical protein